MRPCSKGGRAGPQGACMQITSARAQAVAVVFVLLLGAHAPRSQGRTAACAGVFTRGPSGASTIGNATRGMHIRRQPELAPSGSGACALHVPDATTRKYEFELPRTGWHMNGMTQLSTCVHVGLVSHQKAPVIQKPPIGLAVRITGYHQARPGSSPGGGAVLNLYYFRDLWVMLCPTIKIPAARRDSI